MRVKDKLADGTQVAPCVKCGECDIVVHNPGYSSFNVGQVTCPFCGYAVKVAGRDTDAEFLAAWNEERSRLMAVRERCLAEARGIDKLLAGEAGQCTAQAAVLPENPAREIAAGIRFFDDLEAKDARLRMFEEGTAALRQIGEQVRTQNNHMTEAPVFAVLEKRRIWGVEEGDGFAWRNAEDFDAVGAEEAAAFEEGYQLYGDVPDGYVRVCYLDTWSSPPASRRRARGTSSN